MFFFYSFAVHFILIQPVLSDHLSYVILVNVPFEGNIRQVQYIINEEYHIGPK